MAAQVQPLLMEKEMTFLFINTLHAPYYDRMVGNAIRSFTDMVLSGELIENAIRSEKLETSDNFNAKSGV